MNNSNLVVMQTLEVWETLIPLISKFSKNRKVKVSLVTVENL
jgi:hypothetical protein